MKGVIATRNHHKLQEIRAILSVPSWEWVALDEVPGMPDEVVRMRPRLRAMR